MYDYDIVCIGSGPAGQRAAVQASKLGKRAAVVERRHSAGGVCIETGTIPSKTFREAVRSFMRLSASGADRAARVRPSMAELAGRVTHVVQRELEIVQDQLERNDVAMLRGRAFFRDRHTLEIHSFEGVRTVTAENFLVCVGTVPAEPGDVLVDGETVMTSDAILDMDELPRSLAVIGGGVIGVEYASMFANLGVKVTLVDRRPRPLEFLDGEIVDELIHQMRCELVTLRCGEAVASIDVVESPHKAGLITLESGKHVVAQKVLYSIGRVGATADLGLENIGLSADSRGRLTVDGQFRTEAENIYAAGDVIGFPALAATSSEQGRLASCHMFGIESEPMRDNFPVGIYSIPEISMVGATEEELTRDKVPYESGVARFREIARGQILGDDSGLLKLLFHRDTRELLGIHCIGTHATELIHVGQAVLTLGGGLDYFLSTVFNYPTLAECYKVAAYNAANKLRFAAQAAEAHGRRKVG
ncbi:Si-specific NAD(P)(+) transhydrogenase [Engelhardtia mirabilis]|uniref:Soluble pyridine nucleotide transhydrogenase n=1 Tax=Engelhardtia mirabilis TaxID=2528011 RepID=A0A518BMV4_9BACT|nr:Soluble pyridine nucleotide transhydrogenase [Planctomycetes bacterium Pla133]QDV02646.1 Soluble pyridine nucleotide transhydrogenase [Planctomycetes bacterium Pla86]